MFHARRMIVLASVAAAALLSIAGCASDNKATSADSAQQQADHPRADHPKADHPK